MSEIGNKAALKRVAERLQILDSKGFPSVLDMGAVIAVINVGDYLGPTIEQWQVEASNSLNGLTGDNDEFDLVRPALSGAIVGQTSNFNDRAGPNQGAFDFIVLAGSVDVVFAAAPAAGEVGDAIIVNLFMLGSEGGLNPVPLVTTAAGGGQTIDADILRYRFGLYGNLSGTTEGLGTNLVRLPSGSGLRASITKRDGSGTGPIQAWSAAPPAISVVSAFFGVRVPAGQRIY